MENIPGYYFGIYNIHGVLILGLQNVCAYVGKNLTENHSSLNMWPLGSFLCPMDAYTHALMGSTNWT